MSGSYVTKSSTHRANFELVFANDEDDRERVPLLHTENLMESAGSLKELAEVMEYTKRNP